VERVELQAVDPGDIDSEPVRGDVLGYTGEMYCGRPVVLFLKRPEVFGCEPLKRESKVRLTLHNGILNHMEVGDLSRSPTPYWAVLDAASDLKSGFTVEQVLSRALTTVGDDNQLNACRICWYVLKSHQTHPKQRYRGMSFIFEEEKSDGRKLMSIRGRRADETHEFFDEGRKSRNEERMASRGGAGQGDRDDASGVSDEEPLVTHVVGNAR
jgi:hypothetical protein